MSSAIDCGASGPQTVPNSETHRANLFSNSQFHAAPISGLVGFGQSSSQDELTAGDRRSPSLRGGEASECGKDLVAARSQLEVDVAAIQRSAAGGAVWENPGSDSRKLLPSIVAPVQYFPVPALVAPIHDSLDKCNQLFDQSAAVLNQELQHLRNSHSAIVDVCKSEQHNQISQYPPTHYTTVQYNVQYLFNDVVHSFDFVD